MVALTHDVENEAAIEQARQQEERLRQAGMIRLRQSGEVGSAEATQPGAPRETPSDEARDGP